MLNIPSFLIDLLNRSVKVKMSVDLDVAHNCQRFIQVFKGPSLPNCQMSFLVQSYDWYLHPQVSMTFLRILAVHSKQAVCHVRHVASFSTTCEILLKISQE